MIDEDVVETSDVEELAEFETSSDPLRAAGDHRPRKKIKLCHEDEQRDAQFPDENILSLAPTKPASRDTTPSVPITSSPQPSIPQNTPLSPALPTAPSPSPSQVDPGSRQPRASLSPRPHSFLEILDPLRFLSDEAAITTTKVLAAASPQPSIVQNTPLIPAAPSPSPSQVDPGSRQPRASLSPRPNSFLEILESLSDEEAMTTTTTPAEAEAEAEQHGRYSFRKRNAAQLAPYTADLILYKRALQSNPDAIVKMKQIERHIQLQQHQKHPDDHYEEDGQDNINPLDAADDEDWEWRKKRRLEKGRELEEQPDLSNLPAILQELFSTDEEEKEMDAASKEARRFLRAKEKEKKLREREERRCRQEEDEHGRRERIRRPAPYPLSKSPKRNGAEPEPGRGSPSSFHSLPNLPNEQNSDVFDEGQIVRDYFQNDDFEMFELGDAGPGEPISASNNSDDDMQSDAKDESQYLEVSEKANRLSKRRRILGRMVPYGLAEELFQQEPGVRIPEKRVSSPVSDLEDDGPLLPGRTRVRKGANPKDIKDIKGDSESDEERVGPLSSSAPSSSCEESDSNSDSVEILQTYRPQPKLKPEVIEVDSSSDSDGDEDIQFFVQNHRPAWKQRGKTKLREQSIINYMLPRIYTTGGRNSRSKRSSRYKLDIMTTGSLGQGRERQSLLSFDGYKKKPRRGISIVPGDRTTSSRTPFGRTQSRSTNEAFLNGDGGPGVNEQHNRVQDGKQLGRRERERRRKARAKGNGIYNFASGGNSRITNGRRADAAFFTVDLEDEGFHHALAPISSGLRPRFEPAAPKKRKDYERTHSTSTALKQQKLRDMKPASVDSLPPQNAQESNVKHITCDLNVKRLNSGRSFSQSTYIRKGWLHELVNIESTSVENDVQPPTTLLCRLELSPTMGVEGLCLALPKLLDALFESATDILDGDSDTRSDEWKPGFRVASQIVSWYFRNSEDSQKTRLCETTSKEVQRIANLIDIHSVTFIEKPILALCWFLVELSARTSSPLPTAYHELSLPLKVTSKVLIQLLLRLGIHKVSDLLQGATVFDDSTPSQLATEVWVRLIHLLGTPKDGVPKSKSHPFWTLFMDVLPTVQDKDSGRSFKASEDVWLTIFTLCTLSQFSVHGMVTTEPRLPAFWDLVAYGLKMICLTESEDHHRLHSPVLRKRDHYVALVVTRCGYLRDAWNWRLDEGSAMFNQLAEIFRSRNFANLRHEEDCLPKFFKHAKWDLLSVHDTKDTAFSAFLKLILQADRDEVNNERKTAKLKKLLSLAVPLRSLSFTSSQPHGRELSMFFNRLSAITLALSLDASDHDERINKARNYLSFGAADVRTRHAILCGLERLALLMVKRDISLTAMLDWIEELGNILDAELKVVKNPNLPAEDLLMIPAVNLVKHLFLSISHVMTTFMEASRFPEPHLLGKLKPLFGPHAVKNNALKNGMAVLLDNAFSARSKALPVSARPFTPEEDNGESQNYFDDFDDIDFSAIDDLPGAAAKTSDIAEKDRIFCQNVDPRLRWMIYQELKPYLSQAPPPSTSPKTYSNECDKWLRLWLCFYDIQGSQDNKWVSCVDYLDKILRPGKEGTSQDNDNEDPWLYRVNLSIMFQLLQLDPMAYLTFRDRALQGFFCALVSDTLNLESQYISYLLSIDCLRHPLFAGCGPHLPQRDPVSADFQFSAEEFADLRLPLIGVIFRNVELYLSRPDEIQPESKLVYVDFCHKMFSWMRRVRSLLMQKAGEGAEKVASYTQFCGQVLDAFQECPLLRSQSRLEFFSGWARTLMIPQ